MLGNRLESRMYSPTSTIAFGLSMMDLKELTLTPHLRFRKHLFNCWCCTQNLEQNIKKCGAVSHTPQIVHQGSKVALILKESLLVVHYLLLID